MKYKTIFIIAFILYLIFGLTYIFFPVFAMSYFDTETTTLAKQFITRWWGVALLGLGTTLIFALKAAPDSIGLRSICIGHFVHFAAGFFLSIANNIWASPKPLMWAIVVLFGILRFCLGCWCSRKKPEHYLPIAWVERYLALCGLCL